VTVRGPLLLVPVTRERLTEARPITGRQPLPPAVEAGDSLQPIFLLPEAAEPASDEEAGHVPHSTLVGVTVEVAVAIAVASFLVGAASTGVLWLLHSRAVRLKSVGAKALCMRMRGSGKAAFMQNPYFHYLMKFPTLSAI